MVKIYGYNNHVMVKIYGYYNQIMVKIYVLFYFFIKGSMKGIKICLDS